MYVIETIIRVRAWSTGKGGGGGFWLLDSSGSFMCTFCDSVISNEIVVGVARGQY